MNREEAITYAKKYIEDLLSFFGLNTDVATHCEEDVIELSIPSTHLNAFLIGQRGETMRSLQYLLSMTLKNKDAELSRVNVDVASYKHHRAERLADQVREWCEKIVKTGKTTHLKPMNPADRRVAHKVVEEYGSLTSHSEGESRDRHLVVSVKTDAIQE